MHMLDNELAQTFKRSTARNYKTAKKVSKLSNNQFENQRRKILKKNN